jgi:hypothetical protein
MMSMGKNNKKYTIEEVREIVESKGYELLSEEYVNSHTKMNFKDTGGYLYHNTLTAILGYSNLNKFGKYNKYAIDNIKLYLLKNTDTKIIEESYICSNSNATFRCGCNNIFKRKFSNMIQQKTFTCKTCGSGGRIKNIDLSNKEVNSIAKRHGLLLCGQYINTKVKSKYKDKNGYLYSLTLDSVKKEKCNFRKFGVTNDYTLENIKNWIKINNKYYSLISNSFSKYKDALEFRCDKDGCGEFFKTSVHSLVTDDYNCPYCSGRRVGISNCLHTKRPDLCEEFNILKNKKYSTKSLYYRSTKNIWWKCKVCEHEWKTSPNNRVRLHSGCPGCSSSNMERAIKHILIENNINHEAQKTFKGCKNKQALYFDFYIPLYNLAIEANGKQHYQAVDFFGGQSVFEEQKKKDQIKRDYCKNNNIKLIEIPYWDFDNIEEILIRELDLKEVK